MTAPSQTREGYVAAVEPICKRNTEANEQILAGARGKIKRGRLDAAAGQFARAAAAFGKAVAQIRAVPQPPGDELRLGKWLGHLEDETRLLSEIHKRLKEGEKSKVQVLSLKLAHNGNLANNAVLTFEFDYCLIKSSRFS